MAFKPEGIRLNKFISDTGICSRREADKFIEEGRVRVNGQVASMGMRITVQDKVSVGNKPLRANPEAVYLAYNKPVGIVSTTDSREPDNIVKAVNYKGGRIFPIGRLDKPSEGLILLTNDGNIVNKILRAGNAHDKEYLVWVDKPITADFIRRMSQGVPILGQVTLPCPVRQVSTFSFNIILQQGLNRQIRRMAEYLGFEVTRLKRLRIMNIQLGNLKPGEWRLLNKQEMDIINTAVDSSSSEAVVEPKIKTTKLKVNKPKANKPRQTLNKSKQINKPKAKSNSKPKSKRKV